MAPGVCDPAGFANEGPQKIITTFAEVMTGPPWLTRFVVARFGLGDDASSPTGLGLEQVQGAAAVRVDDALLSEGGDGQGREDQDRQDHSSIPASMPPFGD